jgi:hypothetical protein
MCWKKLASLSRIAAAIGNMALNFKTKFGNLCKEAFGGSSDVRHWKQMHLISLA